MSDSLDFRWRPRALSERCRTLLLYAIPLIVLALTRWWSHADLLVDSDCVNYARALTVFDLSRYAPHPPGYILFVLLGRAVHHWIPDPNSAYQVVNCLFQGVTLVLATTILRSIVDDGTVILLSFTILFHPLFWYYGSTAMVYSADAAVMLLVGWTVWRFRLGPRLATAARMGFLWGLIGGVRQFTSVLVSPLVLWSLWRQRRRPVVAAALLCAFLGVLIWLIPLLRLAGGWEQYDRACSGVFSYCLRTRSLLFSENTEGALYNVLLWVTAWSLLLWPLIPLIVIASIARFRARGLASERRELASMWFLLTAPAAAFYLLILVGQMGFMLGFLVPGIIVMSLWAGDDADGVRRTNRWFRRMALVTALMELAWFVLSPAPAQKYPFSQEPGFYISPHNWRVVLAKAYNFESDFTLHGLRRWTEIEKGYLDAIDQFRPDSAVLIYHYDREFMSAIPAYYSTSVPLLARAWLTRDWTCEGQDCTDINFAVEDSITIVTLPPRISVVLIVDDSSTRPTDSRIVTPLLGKWGKGLIFSRYPGVPSVDNLRIVWAPR